MAKTEKADKSDLPDDVKSEEVINNGNSKFFDPMSVTWSEKYDAQLSKFWARIPNGVAQILATVAVFAVGISINGSWLGLGVHVAKQFGYFNHTQDTNKTAFSLSRITLESLYLKDLWSFWLYSTIISYGIYYVIGGFLHWYYYVRRRDTAEQWKIQPTKWLPPDLERHEILLGSFTLFCNSTFTSILACFIANGGYCSVYYKISDYGWTWFFLQFAVVFLYQDYVTYWLHRIYHTPFLYKNFHKLHHKYKQPTAFSVTAIHPIEALHIQASLCLPLFFLPVHWFPFYFVALYTYYHGIIDHSGIDFKAFWWQPWQPDAVFHDNHHQYFHVNFAFNIYFWDKLHGTYRRKDRVYTEEIFYGTGKSLAEASAEELKADLEERQSENVKAHRDVNDYLLNKDDLKNIKANGVHVSQFSNGSISSTVNGGSAWSSSGNSKSQLEVKNYSLTSMSKTTVQSRKVISTNTTIVTSKNVE